MDFLENVIEETTLERGNELKAILFDYLLSEYRQQNEYLTTLLELFLVHFYHINDDMKDFVQLLINEATRRLEGKLLEDEKMDWYVSMTSEQKTYHKRETRARYFRNTKKINLDASRTTFLSWTVNPYPGRTFFILDASRIKLTFRVFWAHLILDASMIKIECFAQTSCDQFS